MTREPSFESRLALLRKGLDAAWRTRSPGEREAWQGELRAMETTGTAGRATALEVVRQRGALSGWVAPLELVEGLAADNPHALLDSVATSFDRSRTADGWLWQMRTGPRNTIFREFAKDPASLSQALSDVAQVATDTAGEALRRILITRDVSKATVPSGDADPRPALEARLQALGWARAAAAEGLLQADSVLAAQDAARRDLAGAIQNADCERMLAGGFYGYESELARLKAFALQTFAGPRVPVLPLEGVGGAGKSTLLAALLRDTLGGDLDGGRLIVVQIDFDRMLFRNGGELELSFEVARQIGFQVPKADAELRRLRDQTRKRRSGLGEDAEKDGGSIPQASLLVSAEVFATDARAPLSSAGVGGRPLLLLLDTFEEWRRPPAENEAQPTSDPLNRLVEWLLTLKDIMGLRDLRVIISGRVTLDGFGNSLAPRPRVRLSGLGKAKSRDLLRAQGLTAGEADRMLRLLVPPTARPKWIPLTLRLAARMLTSLPDAERQGFLAGNETLDAGVDEALRQGLLYRRYLEHMRPGDVRVVALPGLTLRRVTKTLISQVLAGPCELGEVTDARAADLFAELEREVWLVQREGEALVHRPDVRSVMIRLIAADPKWAAKVVALHKAAVRWYRTPLGEAELGPDAARQEALYHELALLSPEADLPQLRRRAGGSDRDRDDLRTLLPVRDDFGPRLAAQLRFIVEGWVPQDEAEFLPTAARSTLLREEGQRLVQRGEAAAAARLFRQIGDREPHWLAQAEVEAILWRETFADPGGYVRRLESDHSDLGVSVRLKHHVLRAFLRDDPDTLTSIARAVEASAAAAGREPPRASDTTLIDTVYFLLVALGPKRVLRSCPSLPRYLVSLAREQRSVRRTFEDWRRAAIVASALGLDSESAEALRETSPQVVVAGMLRPNPAFVDRYRASLSGIDAPTAHAAVDRYHEALMSTPSSSAELLFTRPAEATQPLINSGDDRVALTTLPSDALLLATGDPELRPAIRLAVERAYNTPARFEAFGQVVDQLLPVTPDDFTGRAMAASWRRKGQTQVRLVEFLDRAGVMAQALDAMAGAGAPEVVSIVREGHQRWVAASTRLFQQVSGDRIDP